MVINLDMKEKNIFVNFLPLIDGHVQTNFYKKNNN